MIRKQEEASHRAGATDRHRRIMSTNANMGSIVIMQHLSPQNNQEPQEDQSKTVPPVMPKPFVKFFQGKPEVLGVSQLFIGINHILFGVILTISVDLRDWLAIRVLVFTGVFFWSGIAYVLSGSLSIAASYKPTLGMVKASLGLNIVSCIAVMISVIIFVVFFLDIVIPYYYPRDTDNFCAYYKSSETCEGKFSQTILLDGIASTLLLFTALEFCIALSTSIFGCKASCQSSYSDVAVVIYQTTTLS